MVRPAEGGLTWMTAVARPLERLRRSRKREGMRQTTRWGAAGVSFRGALPSPPMQARPRKVPNSTAEVLGQWDTGLARAMRPEARPSTGEEERLRQSIELTGDGGYVRIVGAVDMDVDVVKGEDSVYCARKVKAVECERGSLGAILMCIVTPKEITRASLFTPAVLSHSTLAPFKGSKEVHNLYRHYNKDWGTGRECESGVLSWVSWLQPECWVLDLARAARHRAYGERHAAVARRHGDRGRARVVLGLEEGLGFVGLGLGLVGLR